MIRVEAARRALAMLSVAAIAAAFYPWMRADPPPDQFVNSQSVSETSLTSAPAVDADTRAIVDGNIFAPTRAAPGHRYNPNAPSGENAATATMGAVAFTMPAPRVFGTILGPAGNAALIADSANASGRLYHEGDRVGDYRLLRIGMKSVTLRGPSGRVEIPVQPRDSGGGR